MESFWESCGARGPLTIEVEGDGDSTGTRHVFDRPFLLIGSGPRSDLLLGHRDVSRRHAYLQVIAGRPFCVDLDSRTGTLVDGGTAAGGWVAPDVPIRIGPYRVRATIGGLAEGVGRAIETNPLSSRGAGPRPRTRSTLEVESPGEPRSISIARTMSLIGGAGRCKIRLATPETSRFLGVLLRTPGGTWAVDLRSSSSLSVNGVCLGYSRLEAGDEIRLGPLVARLGEPSGSRGRDQLPSTRTASVEGPAMVGTLDPSACDLREFLEQVVDAQQYSGEQFRQAVLMMTRLLGSMHRETIDLVREELEQVRNLVGELKALQEDAIQGRTAPRPPPLGWPEDGPISGEPAATGSKVHRDPGDIHLIVGERLAAFERERRGRWSKLSGLLGKTGQ